MEIVFETLKPMNGKVFPLDELEIGVNAPPFHPNCGCSIVEHVGEEAEEPEEAHVDIAALVASLVIRADDELKDDRDYSTGLANDARHKQFAVTMLEIGKYYEPITGVPAVIMAAQACAEAGYGAGNVAVNTNNLFGVMRGSSNYTNENGEKSEYVFYIAGQKYVATAYDSPMDAVKDWINLYPIGKWQKFSGGTVDDWIHNIAYSGYSGGDPEAYEDLLHSIVYDRFMDKWGIYP